LHAQLHELRRQPAGERLFRCHHCPGPDEVKYESTELNSLLGIKPHQLPDRLRHDAKDGFEQLDPEDGIEHFEQ
jgi:hypothetical protein